MKHKIITAACLIIGNEILSGRTKDQNINFLAKQLEKIGIELKEVRIVLDLEQNIIDAIVDLKEKYNYLFTTGGIGSTHDDITAISTAKSFGVKLVKNEEAAKIIAEYYTDSKNKEVMQMAYMPQGSKLLKNPVTSAPGFMIGNVVVMAGVPKIMRSMFQNSVPYLKKGSILFSKEVKSSTREGSVAKYLAKLQQQNPKVIIGSYPSTKGVAVVVKSYDKKSVNNVVLELKKILYKS